MRIQLEEIDLLRPWPTFRLREGHHAIRVLVRIGGVPVGEVLSRCVRRRELTPRRLRRRLERKLAYRIVDTLAREAIAAGPDALSTLSAEVRDVLCTVNLSSTSWRVYCRTVGRHLLHEDGLPDPWPRLIAAARRRLPVFEMPPVTIVVCTRDRPEQLEGCIRRLFDTDYPRFEIMIVDNSRNPAATLEICQRMGVTYLREPRPGLSRARNSALETVQTRWVAFTDDDCRPEPHWLRELVRKLQDTSCRCVTGLVLPATLDNSAEIAFEIYGGLGRGYEDVAFSRIFMNKHRLVAPETWTIGAGANMLMDAELARELGGFDLDLGAGSSCPCSEDTLLWYQILRAGHSIHYTPRSIVHHHHRSTPDALRKQIYNYAIGHAAYHLRCFASYGDVRSLLRLVYFLPKWFWRNYRLAARGKTKYPRSLIPLEARGSVRGVFVYSAVKTKRIIRRLLGRAEADAGPAEKPIRFAPDTCAAEPSANNNAIAYESPVEQEPVRAA